MWDILRRYGLGVRKWGFFYYRWVCDLGLVWVYRVFKIFRLGSG